VKKHELAVAALAAIFTVVTGCGYGLVGRTSSVPPEVKAVFLKPFENRTARAQVDQILQKAIADELVTRHRFSLVGSAEAADAVLAGAIVSFNVQPISFDAQGRGLQYEIAIVAAMKFDQRRPKERTLWQNDKYIFRETYQIDATQTGYTDQEIVAIRSVAGKFAQTAVTDLLEGF